MQAKGQLADMEIYGGGGSVSDLAGIRVFREVRRKPRGCRGSTR